MSMTAGSYAPPLGHEVLSAQSSSAPEEIINQMEAVMNLPPYDVHVTNRKSIGEPEQTPQAEYHSELVYFSDGAIRELTRATPNARWSPNISPYPVSATDALGTGPKGINRNIIIKGLAERGYYVEWLHHQGRHAEIPTNPEALKRMIHFIFGKSVGRSAHHQHALFDHLAEFGGVIYDPSQLLSVGDSRSAETGEAVDALAPQNNRRVLYGDYTAACFEHKPEPKEIPELLSIPLREGFSLGKLALGKLIDFVRSGDPRHITDYAGTLDLHPMNQLHELAWIWPLMCGDAGKYAKAVPLDAVGTRTLMTGDVMSQHLSLKEVHKPRRHIRFLLIDGTHFDLVRQQQDRLDRFERLAISLREHDFSFADITKSEMDEVIYGKDSKPLAA